MPRTARKDSKSGYYHVMLRGNGKCNIFENDGDRRRLLGKLRDAFRKYEVRCIAWCFMDNHVHVLADGERSALSKALRDAMTSYVVYFNKATRRTGHLFEDRYKSVPIESNEQLLAAVRYVHGNPGKAHICDPAVYPWSSYSEYLGDEHFTDTKPVLDILGGRHAFIDFSKDDDHAYCPCFSKRAKNEEAEERLEYLLKMMGISRFDIATLPIERRNACLKKMRAFGMTVPQIVRLTGLGEWTVKQATKETQLDPTSRLGTVPKREVG